MSEEGGSDMRFRFHRCTYRTRTLIVVGVGGQLLAHGPLNFCEAKGLMSSTEMRHGKSLEAV
jgi:hypothetical protein